MAVILCDTGIALLAYMDGITGSPTLGGVVLAACAAAGSAVYKVSSLSKPQSLLKGVAGTDKSQKSTACWYVSSCSPA